jgi:alpha-L-fucosidase
MQERLLQIGEWLKFNGEAIYGAKVSPFWPRRFEWGTISSKPGKLFLHVHDPDMNQLTLEGLNNPVQKASLFTKEGVEMLSVTQEAGEIHLQWPRHLSNEAATVIMLDIEGEPSVDRTQRQFSDGEIFFNCRSMKINGDKAEVHYEGWADRLQIRNWVDPDEFISAEFILLKPGEYDVEVTYAATDYKDGSQIGWEETLAGSEFQVEIGEYILEASSELTDGEVFFRTFSLGSVKLKETGHYSIVVRPRKGGIWHGLALQAIRISPSYQ